MTMHRIHPGESLEAALELIDDPAERAALIEEAWSQIVTTAVEVVVVDAEVSA